MSGTEPDARRRPGSTAAAARATAATAACALPVFFTGALAVQLTTDLGFGAVGLGAAVAIHHAFAALAAIPAGRIADRLGAVFSLRLAVSLAIASSLGIAFATTSWLTLTLWLVLGGSSRGFVQPAANRLLVHRVRPDRLGIAFGVKQSAPPVASMLGGLSVPLIGLTLGWRWAFAFAAVLCVAALSSTGRRPPAGDRARRAAERSTAPLRDRPTLVVLAVALAFGFATNSILQAFFVVAAVDAGTTEQLAGTMLAVASIGTILARLAAGLACDRTDVHPLTIGGTMLLLGGLGMLVLVFGPLSLFPIASVVVIVGTWGFPGLLWLSLMRAYPEAPGRVTGAVAPGSLGGIVGPTVFGLIVERAGYAPAWILTTVIATVSATLMLVASRRLKASTPPRGS